MTGCSGGNHVIQVETLELASGQYYGLAWGGTQVERFHVVAHSDTRDGDVVIISPQLATPCHLGMLSGYQPVRPLNGGSFVLGSPSPARIAVLDMLNADGRGRLGFVGVDCQRTALEVSDISLSNAQYLASVDLMHLSLAFITSDRRLMFVDPWAQTQTTIASDVTALRSYDAGVWLVEGGQAVQRDLEGKELARYGSAVQEFLPLADTGDIAYVDEHGLFLRRKGSETKVADDACHVRSLGGFLSQAIGYSSPCASGNLVVRDGDGKTFTYDHVPDQLIAQAGRLWFKEATATTSKLWLAQASAPSELELIGERVSFRLDNVWTSAHGKLILQARQPDGTTELWTVTTTKDAASITTIETGIAALSTYQNGMAVLKADGTFSLRRSDNMQVLVRAQGVPRSGFRFVFGANAAALAYLTRVDPGTGLGRLELHFMSGDHFVIASDVRELHEVWWPEPGILYAAGGARPGAYFARVDVPCEITSDSPWACGF
ncbi:MAG TPA: hypothetical protein VF331_25840 [Polyangiales bacterium]